MDLKLLRQQQPFEWIIHPHGTMRVPAIIFGSENLIQQMDMKVYQQICNVATLPGIVRAAYAMPDAHWGYGFPIGGVAAFDPDEGGVVSAGGVGYDISCGVRFLHTGLHISEIESIKEILVDALFAGIPAGVGSTSAIRLNPKQMEEMLKHGAQWAIKHGYGFPEDLEHIEENGCMKGADPTCVSDQAKKRQRDEMGTLGSGNHYLEVQLVSEIYDQKIAQAYGLSVGDVVISIHCGSRGLGHQIGTEFLREMLIKAPHHKISLPDRELACAPIRSPLGEKYFGAMRAGINCALANRQIITHFTREVFRKCVPDAKLRLVYDVSHNTCKEEIHIVDGKKQKLYVHRKGATRAFGPENPNIPKVFQHIGQPVIIGGSMGTASYVLCGTAAGESLSFNSACHGAGRAMSRHDALKKWRGADIINQLASQGILIRSTSFRGVAEEAPDAYKDVSEVVNATDKANLAKKVVKLKPILCLKG